MAGRTFEWKTYLLIRGSSSGIKNKTIIQNVVVVVDDDDDVDDDDGHGMDGKIVPLS